MTYLTLSPVMSLHNKEIWQVYKMSKITLTDLETAGQPLRLVIKTANLKVTLSNAIE